MADRVIASAECFVVASHIGINCAVSNEFVHLTLLLLLCRFPVVLLHCSVLPVQSCRVSAVARDAVVQIAVYMAEDSYARIH